jgi:hypothetical protein
VHEIKTRSIAPIDRLESLTKHFQPGIDAKDGCTVGDPRQEQRVLSQQVGKLSLIQRWLTAHEVDVSLWQRLLSVAPDDCRVNPSSLCPRGDDESVSVAAQWLTEHRVGNSNTDVI